MSMTRPSQILKKRKDAWKAMAENIYSKKRAGGDLEIAAHVRRVFSEEVSLVSPLVSRCPGFATILGFILEDKFGYRVRAVDKTVRMEEWGEEDCRRVGCSLSTFIRKRKTGAVAIDSWRLNYTQLDVLFKEVVGFEEFMLVIANNTMRDSIYGMVYRVTVGAVLSTVDAVTDIYVISTYYHSEELYGKANAMLAMLLGNIFLQIGFVLIYPKKKNMGWSTFFKEVFITLLFLRPAVDAYRISTDETIFAISDPIMVVMITKVFELASESIPGCVLQLYVWLSNPDEAGTYALVSIGISCLTTGFASAMIAYDLDVDLLRRKDQPKFYGYIPNDNSLRGRCFVLMTLMSSLHVLSRSLGFALLALSDTDNLVLIFVGAEIGAYLLFKILGQDFYYFLRDFGKLAIILSFLERCLGKIIVDFTGCIHFRHPYELGGLLFSIMLVWAQVFPFIALQFGADSAMKDGIFLFLAVNFILWLLLNIAFFSTINRSYLHTFFGTKTAPQYACQRFLDANEDFSKWIAAFWSRIEYNKRIEREVKEWVRSNIEEWKREKPDWFNTEIIPDDYLPEEVLEAEGGGERRRSSVSMREIVGLSGASVGSRVHPQAVEEMKDENL